MPTKSELQCQRCGTCCRKGGPALHRQDRHLVIDGHLSIGHLFTIRKGEPVRDDVRGVVAPSDGEIIKIKGGAGGWVCTFFDEAQNSCRVYTYRPFECRLLCCRNTAAIEKVYHTDRLTRSDLIGHIDGLWSLIEQHQQHCDYRQIAASMVKASAERKLSLSEPVAETVRYDRALRELIVDKGLVAAQALDFMFGRPVANVVRDMKRFEMLHKI
jgi:Fe-S-cluster containining protein